jgi:hypothetical protein
MPTDPSSNQASPKDLANALRIVLSRLLQDRTTPVVDSESMSWHQPIFVLRSAGMDRLAAFLNVARAHRPMPPLHIMSHARDEPAIRALDSSPFTFYPYPTPGSYRVEEVAADTLARLRAVRFGALVFLDAGNEGARLDEVERLVGAIGETKMVSFRADGTFAGPEVWREYRLATAAFHRLIEWYHFKLDPGFPSGPVLPGEAIGALRK